MLLAGFEPVQNLILDSLEWVSAAVITTIPQSHLFYIAFLPFWECLTQTFIVKCAIGIENEFLRRWLQSIVFYPVIMIPVKFL